MKTLSNPVKNVVSVPVSMSISVVVITYNRLEKLKGCLRSIDKILPDAHRVVIDNNSSDNTKFFLEKTKDVYPVGKIEIVLLDENHGVARARNIGIKNALERGSEFIVLLDDDARLEKLDIFSIENYFSTHPDIGIIAPHIFYADSRDQESVRSFPTLPSVFWRGTGLYRIFPNVPWYKKYIENDFKNNHAVDWAIGAFQIIRADVFEKIGLLDEHYFFGYEDIDFCLRAQRAGYHTYYWHNARIIHDYARTSAKGLNKNLLRHCGSICRFFYRRFISRENGQIKTN